jgi:predicted transcriptional regulator
MLSDSEILPIQVDLLKLLSKSDYDGYRLCQELGITYRACFFHLRILEKAGLIGGRLKNHITPAGRRIYNHIILEGRI